MGKKFEMLFFLIVFVLFGFYLFQPERRAVVTLYGQKFFLYMNRANSKVIFGRNFIFERKVSTYGENVILQPGDVGIAPCSLSYGNNTLLFSVKRTIGIGENPVMIVVVTDDTLIKQEIWSKEWMYVKAKVKISKQIMISSFAQIICERKNFNKLSQKLVLSKMYIINKKY